jgi:hypothetical protein
MRSGPIFLSASRWLTPCIIITHQRRHHAIRGAGLDDDARKLYDTVIIGPRDASSMFYLNKLDEADKAAEPKKMQV